MVLLYINLILDSEPVLYVGCTCVQPLPFAPVTCTSTASIWLIAACMLLEFFLREREATVVCVRSNFTFVADEVAS